MRLTLLGDVPHAEPTAEVSWDIGAAVLRAGPGGWVFLELGPADGPPQLRLALEADAARGLAAGLRRVGEHGGEAVVMA